MRVWLKHEDIPGLAMSRSMGDLVACKAGVHGEPEIKKYQLKQSDKIVVIASDGVWEFLSNDDVSFIFNEKVAKIVYPFFANRNAEAAAEALVRESFFQWKNVS